MRTSKRKLVEKSMHSFAVKNGNCLINNRRLNRRSKYDIIVDILKSARHGERKTRIMAETKLSYAQLKFYLDFLHHEGFLENLKGLYMTTLKGNQYIKDFETINIFSL